MIPKSINIEKYAKKYLQDIQNNDFLMNVCKINEDVEFILSDLDEDEKRTYDEDYIKEIVDIIIPAIKDIALENLQDNPDCYNILFDISTKYMDIARGLMEKDIPVEEKQNMMRAELSEICNNLIAKYAQEACEKEQMRYEKEMFALNHPILALLQKITIPIILLIVALWIVMTVLVANGTIELPEKIPVIAACTVFGIFAAFILYVIIGSIISSIRGDKQ